MLRKDFILEHTFSLYSRYGIKRVGVSDVATMLGMSKKTIYEHFKNREELIEESISYQIDSFLKKMKKEVAAEKGVFRKLAAFYACILKGVETINPVFMYDLKKYLHDQYKVVIELREHTLFEEVSSIYEQGVKAGLFRVDLPVNYLFYNQIDKISVLLDDLHGDLSLPEMSVDVIFRLILNDIRGMTTVEGHEKMDAIYDSLVDMI